MCFATADRERAIDRPGNTETWTIKAAAVGGVQGMGGGRDGGHREVAIMVRARIRGRKATYVTRVLARVRIFVSDFDVCPFWALR